MNYLLKNKPKRSFNSKYLIVVSLFVFLFMFSFFFPNFSRNISTALFKPMWFLKDKSVSVFRNTVGYFTFKKNLISENQRLNNEVNDLRLTKIDYDNLLKQNDEIKKILGREINGKKVLASILSKPPQSPFDTFILDVGVNDLVEIGQKVYVGENIVIGEIGQVSSDTSIVSLYSMGGKENSAILDRTGATYIIKGSGGANYKLEVPKDTDILWGDIFNLPGIDNSILGSVYFIDTNSQSSFKTVYIRVPGNIFATKYVYIAK